MFANRRTQTGHQLLIVTLSIRSSNLSPHAKRVPKCRQLVMKLFPTCSPRTCLEIVFFSLQIYKLKNYPIRRRRKGNPGENTRGGHRRQTSDMRLTS